MRFMAIIAFCLIAMLALVKNLDRNAPSAVVDTAIAERPLPAEMPVEAERVAAERNAVETDSSDSTSVTLPTPLEPRKAAPKTEAVVAPASPPVANEPGSLTFRFASETDFLKLLATDEVQLYASTSNGFMRLNTDFTLSDERPRHEVFEVMPHSVPAEIERIFRITGERPVYLVDLPRSTRAELKAFLDNLEPGRASGALVIHRDGHITYETDGNHQS